MSSFVAYPQWKSHHFGCRAIRTVLQKVSTLDVCWKWGGYNTQETACFLMEKWWLNISTKGVYINCKYSMYIDYNQWMEWGYPIFGQTLIWINLKSFGSPNMARLHWRWWFVSASAVSFGASTSKKLAEWLRVLRTFVKASKTRFVAIEPVVPFFVHWEREDWKNPPPAVGVRDAFPKFDRKEPVNSFVQICESLIEDWRSKQIRR